MNIYNSRNYYRLLNSSSIFESGDIYNSRNYYRLLNLPTRITANAIYNSRNYYRLLNSMQTAYVDGSTTVEISIGYLTRTANIYMPNLQYYITFLPLIVSSITFYIYTSILHTILVSPSKSL